MASKKPQLWTKWQSNTDCWLPISRHQAIGNLGLGKDTLLINTVWFKRHIFHMNPAPNCRLGFLFRVEDNEFSCSYSKPHNLSPSAIPLHSYPDLLAFSHKWLLLLTQQVLHKEKWSLEDQVKGVFFSRTQLCKASSSRRPSHCSTLY